MFLNFANKDIMFCWVLSHIGISGNEKAVSIVKSALDMHRVKDGIPNTDFKHHINQYILSTWQDDWNGAVANKLHSVKPDLRDWQTSFRSSDRSFVVDSLSYLSFQPVLHDWCNKGSSICYPVYMGWRI